ncbi:MAG: hypothetical protein J6Y88_08305 [Bacteroidales bacterium]|nr:hypothetical protein [Bacteroidales bacterium]
MRRKGHVKSLLAALMLSGMLALSSCDNNLGMDAPDPRARVLTVRVTIPGGVPATKASAGDVGSVDPESMIYNVQVWMFNHQAANASDADGEKAVTYGEVNLGSGWSNSQNRPSGYYDEWTNTTTYEVQLNVPGYIMDRDTSNMKFDFYVLANGPSIDAPLSMTSTRGELKSATFGLTSASDPFGPTAPKAGSTPLIAINGGSASGPGLPISGFFNRSRNEDGTTSTVGTGVNLKFLKERESISDTEMKKLVPVVQIERAVAKLRFVFAKPNGMDGVSVTRIEVDGNLIPVKTFLFPREDGTEFVLPEGTPAYMSNIASIGSLASGDILEVDDPLVLRSDSDLNASKTAQQYEDYLTATIGTKTSTQRFAYIRESDKLITGKIYYKLSADGAEQVAAFSMPANTGTNFHRNHSWTVYSYFNGGSLFVIPHVMPWTVESEISYESEISVSLAPQESYKKRTDVDASHWGYVSVSSGYIRTTYDGDVPIETIFYDNPTENDRPAKAHRITLQTKTSGEDLQLNLDNPNYRFAVYNGTTQKYSYYNPGAPLRITGEPNPEGWITTYFYVMPATTLPIDAPDYEKICHVSLSTTSTSIGAIRIPYNNNALPGASEGSDEIWFYYTSPDVYATTGEWVIVD